jgi:transcriptional regulator GlxA family with amidase domain
LLSWLRKKAAQGAYIAGTCTRPAYLAEAGLLDGREATTHWATADAFRRRYPRANWQPEKLITEDGRILCSGLEAQHGWRSPPQRMKKILVF